MSLEQGKPCPKVKLALERAALALVRLRSVACTCYRPQGLPKASLAEV